MDFIQDSRAFTLVVFNLCWEFIWCRCKFHSHLRSQFGPRHDKTNKLAVRPAKTQVSLGIRPVWSESSLSAWRNIGSLATHWGHSEDSDQTGWMPRLIWDFAGRTLILLVLSCRGSNYFFRRLLLPSIQHVDKRKPTISFWVITETLTQTNIRKINLMNSNNTQYRIIIAHKKKSSLFNCVTFRRGVVHKSKECNIIFVQLSKVCSPMILKVTTLLVMNMPANGVVIQWSRLTLNENVENYGAGEL